jgi:predicted anti-sigma-YlaC factor YlaD
MSCSSFDIKEYFLGEAGREESRQIESHLETCDACREELSRLQLTEASLMALRDEEIPRRIAFVSDKVFEPRWYQRIWNNGPRLGFIAASLVACAILVHAFVRPPTITAPSRSASVDERQIAVRVEREVSARLQEAVAQAVAKSVADSEARQAKKTAQLLQALEQRFDHARRMQLASFTAQLQFEQQKMARDYAIANNLRASE